MTYPWLQEKLEDLTERFKNDRLPHALLLTGQAGVGKFDLAKSLTERLLCESLIACGDCKGNQLLAAGSHPDFRVVTPEEGSQQIKIEQIRELIDWVNQTAQMNGAKISIITPAHKMNRNSANALLKVMEEPPAGNYLILISDEPALLLPTIRSRAQVLPIDIPPQGIAQEWLSEQTGNKDWDALLALSHGSPLLALERADDEYLAQRQIFAQIWLDLWRRQRSVVELSNAAQKLDLVECLELGIALLADVSRLHATNDDSAITNKDVREFVTELSGLIDSHQALYYMSLFERDFRLARGTQNPNKTLLLEALMIDCLKPAQGPLVRPA